MLDRCWCALDEISHTFSNLNLVTLIKVFVLKRFTKYLGDLLCSLNRICTDNELWVTQNKFSQVFVLRLSFLDIVGDWKTIYPVSSNLLAHLKVLANISFLEFDNLTNTSDSVISSVIELRTLLLLFSYFA